jgi:hypothetical protein
MSKDTKIVDAFKDGKPRKAVARALKVPVAKVDQALRRNVQPGGGMIKRK